MILFLTYSMLRRQLFTFSLGIDHSTVKITYLKFKPWLAIKGMLCLLIIFMNGLVSVGWKVAETALFDWV